MFKINKQNVPNSKSEPLYTKNLLIKNYILNENDIIHFDRKDKQPYIHLLPIYNSPVEEIILPPPEVIKSNLVFTKYIFFQFKRNLN